jgi:hypothetical protein
VSLSENDEITYSSCSTGIYSNFGLRKRGIGDIFCVVIKIINAIDINRDKRASARQELLHVAHENGIIKTAHRTTISKLGFQLLKCLGNKHCNTICIL